MADRDKANKAAERLAQTTRDSYQLVLEHNVGLQERNVRFAQGVVDGSIREMRQQAEANRALVAELVERAEKQRDAFQTLVGVSVDAYMDLLFAPFARYRQGLRLVEDELGGGFPIRDYDELNVAEVSRRIEGLSLRELRQVRDYEKNNKNRETLVQQLDRKLKAAS
jgi:hypothetical protein